MSLLLWQELFNEDKDALLKARRYTIGELKQIDFLINKPEDKGITDEQEELSTAWHNGERINEDALSEKPDDNR